MRQERVKHTAAEKSPCGCDVYVRQKWVNRIQSRVLVCVTCM